MTAQCKYDEHDFRNVTSQPCARCGLEYADYREARGSRLEREEHQSCHDFIEKVGRECIERTEVVKIVDDVILKWYGDTYMYNLKEIKQEIRTLMEPQSEKTPSDLNHISPIAVSSGGDSKECKKHEGKKLEYCHWCIYEADYDGYMRNEAEKG